MSERISSIWVYLAATPLLWLTLTVAVYWLASQLAQRLGSPPVANPVLMAIIALVGLLLLTKTPYESYFAGAQFVHFMLGPATVALAVPLYLASAKLRRVLVPALVALLVGSATGIASAVLLCRLLGVSALATLSLAPKSITTPIAMGISAEIGGLPSLTAVLVILTGMVGAMLGKESLDLARVRDQSVRGFAMGLAAHGLGTARALQLNAEAGAFSGLAMGLNGAMTAILVPILIPLLT
jgi:predicted murein hydrolase (TIGR00659 family)